MSGNWNKGHVCSYCWDLCQWTVFGQISAGHTPEFLKGGDTGGAYDFNLGAQGAVKGNWNICTGEASVTADVKWNVGIKYRIPNPVFSKWFKAGPQYFQSSFNHQGTLADVPLVEGKHLPILAKDAGNCP